MQLEHRILVLSEPVQTGRDVDRLHEELAQLGQPYDSLVRRDIDASGQHRFGPATQQAVQAFQEAQRQRLQAVVAGSLDGSATVRWSGVWGTVDPATAQVLNEAVARLAVQWVVRGRVEYEDGTPAEGVRVLVFDRDIGTLRQQLGDRDPAPTNAGGVFSEVHYQASSYARAEGPQELGADLVFQLAHIDRALAIELVAIYRQNDGARQAAETPVADLVLGFPAQPVETLRLVIRRAGETAPSEYERIMAALAPLLDGDITPGQFDEEQHRDLSFAARETHADRALIAAMSQAWNLARESSMVPELFYGLLREGPPVTVQALPADLAELLMLGLNAWKPKLAEAFALRLIPPGMQSELDNWVARLQERRARSSLSVRADPERTTLGELLTHAGLAPERQSAFATLLNGHDGLAGQLWLDLAERLHWSEDEIASVQSAVELSDVLESYAPLLALLFEAETAPSARLLAGWAPEQLTSLIERSGAPADTPGGNAEERRGAYQESIASELRSRYPGIYTARVVAELPDRSLRQAGDWLHAMLTQSLRLPDEVPPFDLVNTPATGYLRAHGERLLGRHSEEERALLSSQLKRVQRVYQLCEMPEQMPLLIEQGLESAHEVVRWSHEHFLEQYGDLLGGADAAAAIHSKARYIHGTLLNLYLDVKKAYQQHGPIMAPDPALAPDMRNGAVPTPSISDLFGSDDLCVCASCLSVLSPAAYFVDLLQWHDLKQPGSSVTNLQVLLKKRPDLAHIQLTCDNTHTRIPYVDLVNEILASYVANELPFAYNDPKDGVTSGTAEELRVNPIALTDAAALAELAAYDKLDSTVFPFQLPYHHWLQVIRLYLGHFAISRAALMRRFQTDAGLDTEMAIAAETLAMSPQEFEVITGARLDGSSSTLAPYLAALYGFVETAAPGTAPPNHVSPDFVIGDLRGAQLRALQNYLKNISPSPGLTPAIRAALKVDGDFSSAATAAPTLAAVQAWRLDHALPGAGGAEPGFWGALETSGQAPLSLMMSHVPMFLRQTGISYDELVGLVSSRSFNPRFNDRAYFSAIGITPEELMAFVQSGLPTLPPAMQAKVTAAGIATVEFLKRVGEFSSVLVLDSPPGALCDIDQTTIRHIDGTLLSAAELLRLQQWIRLWRKLGWTLHEVDLAVAMYPLSDPFTLILRLADARSLLETLAIPLEQLLALWAPIDTWDETSLYGRLFRSKTAQSLDPLFALDPLRGEIDDFLKNPGTPPLLADHIALLLAALRISAAELDLLLPALPDQHLNLRNVSALFRQVVLAKALALPPADCLALQALSGADPLTPPAGEITSAASDFVRTARAIAQAGWPVARLDYLLRHRADPLAPDLLDAGQQRDILGALRVGHEDIGREYVPADDPLGDLLARQLGAVLRTEVASVLARMAYGTMHYSQVLAGVPAGIVFPPPVAHKIVYDADRQELRFSGVMIGPELSALMAPAFIGALPAALQAPFTSAVQQLFAMPQQFADQQLFDLMDGASLMTLLRKASSLAPDGGIDRPAVALKVGALLAEVRHYLSLALVKRVLSDTFHLDEAAAARLLQDQDVLADIKTGGTLPAIEDFLALDGSGIDSAWFANPNLSGAPAAQQVAPGIALGPATVLPAGIGPGAFSVTWFGYLYSPLTEEFTLLLRVRDAVRVWLNGALVLDAWIPQPETEFVLQTKLRKGAINALRIEHAHYTGAPVFALSWRSPSIALAPVPTAAFYTEQVLHDLLAALVRFEKVAVLATGLRLSPADIVAVSRLGYFDWNALPVAAPPAPVASSLFKRFQTLLHYAALRDQLPPIAGRLASLLAQPTLAASLDAFAELTGAPTSELQQLLDASTGHPFNATTLVYDEAPPDALDLAWWSRLRESWADLQRAGCSAAQLVEWSKIKDVARVAPTPPITNWMAMSAAPAARVHARTAGQDLKRLVKAKYDEAGWRAVARAINDELRVRDRDALTAHVLGMPAILEAHIQTADELFEFFLIDLKMDPCMETSRIQQGIATALLHAQRISMGLLEGENPPVKASSIDRQLYQRMQSYALWQPSREILIHTEKYIRWDLLDRKSEAYVQFEHDLRKQDLTQIDDPAQPRGRWAETAFMNFLEKLDEVSKLHICGQYFDQRERVMHVFGRTPNAPHRYYYRRANGFTGAGMETGEWTAWERLPLDIDSIESNGDSGDHPINDNDRGGVHLMPVMWNRRLYLIWPQFRLLPDEKRNLEIPADFDRVNRWEIKLAWSELWNGAWSPKQVSSSTISSPPFVSPFNQRWTPPPEITKSTETIKVGHWVDLSIWGFEIAGHDYTYSVWTPGLLKNELVDGSVDGPGLAITDKNDYAAFATDSTTRALFTYLPDPELHFFTIGQVDGRLTVTPMVRFNEPKLIAKSIEKTRLTLTVKQGDRLTFREKDSDPVTAFWPWDIHRYTQLGTFFLGNCKVRDIEAFTGGLNYSQKVFLAPSGAYNSFQDCRRYNPLGVKTFTVGLTGDTVLNRTEPAYRVHGDEDINGFKHKHPFFFQDRNRVYLVTPAKSRFARISTTAVKNSAGAAAPAKPVTPKGVIEAAIDTAWLLAPEYTFQLHSDPAVCEFIRRLNRGGLFALLATDTQQVKDTTPLYFKTSYQPTWLVATPYPDEGVAPSFDRGGAYSQYHWELFLYAPMRTWSELLKTHQFAEAEAFLKTVANVTSSDSNKSLRARVWQFAPFQTDDGLRIQDTLGLLMYTGSDTALLGKKAQVQQTIHDWMGDPFNPHLIGRRRLSAYMQAVMLDTCRHYLAAADVELTRYTMESIPLALQYLIIVIKVLGPNRPGPKRTAGKTAVETFHTLKTKGHLSPFSDFSLALGDLETEIPFTHSVPTLSGSIGSASSIQSMYFCLPANDEWGTLWDTVADRLFKIRHCMNIDGVVQQLPLFPEPIDPRLLVQARAQGLSISSIFDDFRAPLPHHEFPLLFERAVRMAEDVRSFAQRFESLLEKHEGESLAQMRVEQEAGWLKQYLRRELTQAIALQAAQRQALEAGRAAIEARMQFYDEQIKRGLSEDEKRQRSALQEARAHDEKAQFAEVEANLLSMIPETHAQGTASGSSFGGQQLGLAGRAVGGMFHMLGAQASHDSGMAGMNAQWARRRDEWSHQHQLAVLDLKKTDVELLGARIQENIAQLRVENHDKTTSNTEAVLDAYRKRFFSAEQYSAAAEDLYPDYFALFQLAYQYARQAEACCRFQFALPDLNVIQFGYWNNAKKGLLAGEHLLLALKQLERVYLDNDKREFEIRRDVSLVTLDPVAFIELKQTGHCEFEIPETFVDGDYPGHYMRRLRGASVTIPCVAGRHVSINCMLTLLKNKTRISSEAGAAYEEDVTQKDPRFMTTYAAATQSIATSHAQNDNGMFDSDSRDGRYPPFRGAGLVSRWRIDMPIETNAIDRNSLTDCLLHLPYTARAGGARLGAAAWQAREKALKDPAGLPQRRLFTASFESRDGWHRFLHPEPSAAGQALQIELTCESVSLLFKERTLLVSEVDVYINFKSQSNNAVYRSGPAALSASLSRSDGTVATPAITRNVVSIDQLSGGTPIASFPLAFEIKPGVVNTLRLELPESSVTGIAPMLIEKRPGSTHSRLKVEAIDDMWFVVRYCLK